MSLFVRFSKCVPCFLLLILPLTLGAGPAPNSNAVQARKAIESMSQPQRDRLSRNFDAYRELTPDEKDYYKQLHQKVEEDAIERPVKNLKESMNDYMDWLNTIDPYDRQRIRDESDVNKRMQIVRQILHGDDRNLRSLKLAISRVVVSKVLQKPKSNAGRALPAILAGEALSPSDMNAVLKVLEQEIKFNEAAKNDLDSRTGSSRKAYILRQAVLDDPNKMGLAVNKTIFAKMKNAISDTYFKNKYFGNNLSDDIRPRVLAALMIRSIYFDDIEQQIKETPIQQEEISQFKKTFKKDTLKRMHSVHLDLLSHSSVQDELAVWAVGVKNYHLSSILAETDFLSDMLLHLRGMMKDRNPRVNGRPRPGAGNGPPRGPKGKGKGRTFENRKS